MSNVIGTERKDNGNKKRQAFPQEFCSGGETTQAQHSANNKSRNKGLYTLLKKFLYPLFHSYLITNTQVNNQVRCHFVGS